MLSVAERGLGVVLSQEWERNYLMVEKEFGGCLCTTLSRIQKGSMKLIN